MEGMAAVLQVAQFMEKGTQQENSFEDRALVKGQEDNYIAKYIYIKHICATKISCTDFLFLQWLN